MFKVYFALQEDFDNKFDGPYVEEKYENIADFLSQGLGFTSKSNAWAGPDHWKYRKVKGKYRKISSFFNLNMTVSVI